MPPKAATATITAAATPVEHRPIVYRRTPPARAVTDARQEGADQGEVRRAEARQPPPIQLDQQGRGGERRQAATAGRGILANHHTTNPRGGLQHASVV
eukprot:COSAG05_NODE_9037_length_652_cov_1.204340_1_plen_97_part_01